MIRSRFGWIHIYIYIYTHTLMVLQRSFGLPACVTKGEIHHGAPSKVVEGRFVCLEVWYYIKRSAPCHPGAFRRFNARRRMKIRRSSKAAAVKYERWRSLCWPQWKTANWTTLLLSIHKNREESESLERICSFGRLLSVDLFKNGFFFVFFKLMF